MTITLPQADQHTAMAANQAEKPAAKDLRDQFTALRFSCGLFNLHSRAKLILTGTDRTRWLNGMVTNNIRDLAAGHGVYAFLLNPQGHILGDLKAFNREDSFVIDTDQAQLEKIRSTFDHYIIMDDVEAADASEKLVAIGIAGPKSREVLTNVGIQLPELAPLQFADLTWRDASITLVRSDNTRRESYEIWLAPGNLDGARKALLDGGATAISPEALELIRIADGIPRYGQDIRERDLPQETEQARALHFSKGCYVGQEIVERIRSRGGVHRTFATFSVSGALPAPGTKIQSEGKDVGEITSSAILPLPDGDVPAALGYVRKEAVNKNLAAGEAVLSVSALGSPSLLGS